MLLRPAEPLDWLKYCPFRSDPGERDRCLAYCPRPCKTAGGNLNILYLSICYKLFILHETVRIDVRLNPYIFRQGGISEPGSDPVLDIDRTPGLDQKAAAVAAAQYCHRRRGRAQNLNRTRARRRAAEGLRRRIDQALYAVVMEAYVHGISTRSVDDLVEAMGGRQSARSLHFIFAFALAGFFVVHVLLVLLSGPIGQMRAMISGGSQA